MMHAHRVHHGDDDLILMMGHFMMRLWSMIGLLVLLKQYTMILYGVYVLVVYSIFLFAIQYMHIAIDAG